ncbi:MAG TPA: polysaccharide biosynthesis protein [Hellea balneolensis]|uniref:Polysaccharide biosynthesis protein n=1 Tax=Hellea balneolensis TaxID=287478 RepID=A0A7V5U196_9PROT|nr:polysaccharide biosynthesis protein [Hellea balneolensis]
MVLAKTHAQERNRKDIAKGAGANLAGFVLRLGARVPFLFVAGRLYGAESFGRYVFAVTYVETLAFVCIFGFKSSIFKFLSPAISGGKHRLSADIFLHALLFCLMLAGFAVGLSYAGAGVLPHIFPADMADFAVKMSPAILLYTGAELFLSFTRGFRKMRYEVMVRSFVEPYSLLVLALLFYVVGWHYYGLLVAYLIMSVLSFAIAALAALRLLAPGLSGFRFSPSLLKKLIYHSAPTALHDILNFSLQRLDVYLLSALADARSVGIYGMALQIATSVKKIRQSFDPILNPVMASTYNAHGAKAAAREMARVSSWIALIQCLVISVLFVYGDALMSAFGPAFVSGGLVLFLIVLADLINGTVGISELLLILRKPGLNPVIGTVMFVFHLVLSFILIGRFGAIGAALSVLVTFSLMSLTRLLSVRLLCEIYPLEVQIIRPILAGSLTALGLYAFADMIGPDHVSAHIAGIFVAVIFYGGLIYGFSSPDERLAFRHMAKRRVYGKREK